MKREMSKLLWIVLAGFLLLSGCSKKEDKAQVAFDKETPVTIVVGGWPAGDDAFKAIMPAFNELYPNVTIELDFKQTTDHHQQLSTAIAAGT